MMDGNDSIAKATNPNKLFQVDFFQIFNNTFNFCPQWQKQIFKYVFHSIFQFFSRIFIGLNWRKNIKNAHFLIDNDRKLCKNIGEIRGRNQV